MKCSSIIQSNWSTAQTVVMSKYLIKQTMKTKRKPITGAKAIVFSDRRVIKIKSSKFKYHKLRARGGRQSHYCIAPQTS